MLLGASKLVAPVVVSCYFRPASARLALDLNLNVSGIRPKARSCPSAPDSILSSQVDTKRQGNGDDSLSCLFRGRTRTRERDEHLSAVKLRRYKIVIKIRSFGNKSRDESNLSK